MNCAENFPETIGETVSLGRELGRLHELRGFHLHKPVVSNEHKTSLTIDQLVGVVYIDVVQRVS